MEQPASVAYLQFSIENILRGTTSSSRQDGDSAAPWNSPDVILPHRDIANVQQCLASLPRVGATPSVQPNHRDAMDESVSPGPSESDCSIGELIPHSKLSWRNQQLHLYKLRKNVKRYVFGGELLVSVDFKNEFQPSWFSILFNI